AQSAARMPRIQGVRWCSLAGAFFVSPTVVGDFASRNHEKRSVLTNYYLVAFNDAELTYHGISDSCRKNLFGHVITY
ncbi:MAG: hypothetical protein J1F28_10260, partial [Oscillospiraceae bacterium]|nr:hypothetical protein [Oscillospiraceae bacterium]